MQFRIEPRSLRGVQGDRCPQVVETLPPLFHPGLFAGQGPLEFAQLPHPREQGLLERWLTTTHDRPERIHRLPGRRHDHHRVGGFAPQLDGPVEVVGEQDVSQKGFREGPIAGRDLDLIQQPTTAGDDHCGTALGITRHDGRTARRRLFQPANGAHRVGAVGNHHMGQLCTKRRRYRTLQRLRDPEHGREEGYVVRLAGQQGGDPPGAALRP